MIRKRCIFLFDLQNSWDKVLKLEKIKHKVGNPISGKSQKKYNLSSYFLTLGHPSMPVQYVLFIKTTDRENEMIIDLNFSMDILKKDPGHHVHM